MNILVTGGTGFIGSAVVRLLLERDAGKLFVFHRNPASARSLQGVADQIEWFQGDIGEFSHVLNAVEKARPEVIYHMSAMLTIPSEADPASAIRANAMGTYHVLEAARLFGVRQVFFASSIGTYGYNVTTEAIDDTTLQRPGLIYGATKVFGEHLGLFYRRKYRLDFRGIRYQSIVGPGVKTPGMLQFTSWVIEESIKGQPFTIQVKPELKVPLLYIKDAAVATLQLASAPAEKIRMVTYLIDGIYPTVAELVDMVQAKVPGAQIDFQLDSSLQAMAERTLRPFDGKYARQEWDWQPTYDLGQAVDDFINEVKNYPERYA